MQKIQLILTGATGMVGEGVLHEALQSDAVEKVLIINRKPSGITHQKLKEIIHADFFNLSPIADQLIGYNACFFCLGVSSVGMKEPEFYQKTYVLTMHAATVLSQQNPQMAFCYISGAGTDSTEKGRQMWARVKGKTENDLMKLLFKNVYALRPSFIKPIDGMLRTHSFYKYINWLFPLGRAIFAKGFCTLQELANAMIFLALSDTKTCVVEGDGIIKLAKNIATDKTN